MGFEKRLFSLLGVLDRKAPDIEVIAQVVDNIDGEMGIRSSGEGQTTPQVNVLHVRSKESFTIGRTKSKR